MEKQMSLGDWIVTYLVTCIPIVGIVMLFVWALGEAGGCPSKKTWAQATLVWFLVAIVLWFLVLGSIFAGVAGSGLI